VKQLLARMLGINYRTTILGIGAISAAIGRIIVAYRTRDFVAIANDGQFIAETAGMILAGLGLFIAKDANVTGAGSKAKVVDGAGTVTDIKGKVVGEQPPVK
jgi:hypothetical protein